MLPKRSRVPAESFSRNGKSIFSDGYVTIKSRANHLTHDRLGVVVGLRVSKSAVQRNRLKRKTFGFLEKQIQLNNNKEGKDLILILKPSIINLTNEEMESSFRKYERFV